MDKNKGELLEKAYEGRVSRGHQYRNTVKFFPKYRNTVQNKLKIPSPTIFRLHKCGLVFKRVLSCHRSSGYKIDIKHKVRIR